MNDLVFIFTHHIDAAHGWLEVPATVIDRLGILDKITTYSYYSHTFQKYYLEEDLDAVMFLNACKRTGLQYTIKEKDHGELSFIRKLDRVGSV